MQSMRLCYLGLAVALLSLGCLEAAPSPAKQAKKESLVRVYPISEEQYESLLKLTDGKHVISEGRLTSAGFTAVRNTLDSGWHSLLRIIGLSATHSEQPKVKVDGQPLCVMRRSYSPAEPEGRSASDEESVINCIVVLKRDPNFAPYWYNEQQEQKEQQQQPQGSQSLEKPMAVQETDPKQQDKEEEQQQEQQQEPGPAEEDLHSERPKARKASRRRRPSKAKPAKRVPAYNPLALARQYGPPPSPYGNAFGGSFGSTYPYGGFGQTPFNPYTPYPSPYGQQQPFAPPSAGFGPAPSFGQQPYPFAPPFYGQGQGFNPYPFFEQGDPEASGDEDVKDDDELDQSLEAEVEEDSHEDYYD